MTKLVTIQVIRQLRVDPPQSVGLLTQTSAEPLGRDLAAASMAAATMSRPKSGARGWTASRQIHQAHRRQGSRAGGGRQQCSGIWPS